MRRIGALLSLSLAILAIAVQAEVPRPATVGLADQPAVIAFNPPINLPLLLNVSDDRLLPDGRRVRFDAQYQLIFTRDQQQVIASLRLLLTRCDGARHLCDAFTAAMQPLTGRERRSSIDHSGNVRPLTGPQSGTDLVGDPSVRSAIDCARTEGSEVAAAEIVEALAFVGMPLLPTAGDRIVTVSSDHIDVQEPMPLPGGAGIPSLTMRKSSRIDRTTGLVIASEIDVSGSGSSPPLISHRQWRLSPVGATVP